MIYDHERVIVTNSSKAGEPPRIHTERTKFLTGCGIVAREPEAACSRSEAEREFTDAQPCQDAGCYGEVVTE